MMIPSSGACPACAMGSPMRRQMLRLGVAASPPSPPFATLSRDTLPAMTAIPPPRVALFGYPLTHSVSPAMHHAAAQALDISLRYDLWPIQAVELADAVDTLRG